MPNHCEGDIYIEGPPEKIKEFIEFAKGPGWNGGEEVLLQANKFVPYPQEFLEKDKEYEAIMEKINAMSDEERKQYHKKNGYPKDGYNQGGYQWCCDNWGTKWGFYDVSMEDYKEGQDHVTYHVTTAWSPADKVFEAMVEKFPDLDFSYEYFESGMCFQGVMRGEEGEITFHDNGTYHGSRGG